MKKRWRNIMKIVSKLSIAGRTLLTLDGDILDIDANKVIIGGKEYDFEIAFDMKNTIGVNVDTINEDVVDFS